MGEGMNLTALVAWTLTGFLLVSQISVANGLDFKKPSPTEVEAMRLASTTEKITLSIKSTEKIIDKKGAEHPLSAAYSAEYTLSKNQNSSCTADSWIVNSEPITLSKDPQEISIQLKVQVPVSDQLCSYELVKAQIRTALGKWYLMTDWVSPLTVRLNRLSKISPQVDIDFGLRTYGHHGTYPTCVSDCDIVIGKDLKGIVTLRYDEYNWHTHSPR